MSAVKKTSRASRILYHLRYLWELITTTPRYKTILFLSLLSGAFNFFGLPMLIPVLEYMQEGGVVGGKLQMFQVVDRVLLFMGIEPSFYAVLAIASTLILLGQVLIVVSALVAYYSTYALIKDYSKKVFHSYINADWLWLISTNSGEINYVVLSEAAVAATAHLNAQRFVIAFVQCLAYFLLAIRLSVMSVVLALGVYGALLLINLLNSRRIRLLNDEYNNLNKSLSNSLSGLQQNKKFLKTSLLNSRFVQKIFRNLDVIIKAQLAAGTRLYLQSGWNFIIAFLFLLALIVFRNQMGLNYSSLLILLVVFNRLAPQFNLLSTAYAACSANMPMHISINKRLDDMAENTEKNGADIYDEKEAIRFDNVSFAYPNGDEVIKHLNLTIPMRKTVAFVGGSGAGKSTILDLLLGLLKPNRGVVYYGNIPHTRLDLNSLRNKVAYINQQPTLLDGTRRENLTVGRPDASDGEIAEICKKVHLDEFVTQLPDGLNTRIGENGIKLSGGQRQRVVLGRALFLDPQILILDEATSELDMGSEAMIQQTINELRKELTIIIVAHRLSTVKLADRIFVVENGQICESGTYKELLKKKGRLYYLDSLQKVT